MTLTIPEAKGTYEQHDFLRAANVKAANGKFEIVAEPRQATTQYGERTFVDVKPQEGEDMVFTWVINTTSLRHLAKSFGDQEADWVGKSIVLTTILANVEGKAKEVIYADGALDKTE